jgi:hypothetical protein
MRRIIAVCDAALPPLTLMLLVPAQLTDNAPCVDRPLHSTLCPLHLSYSVMPSETSLPIGFRDLHSQ